MEDVLGHIKQEASLMITEQNGLCLNARKDAVWMISQNSLLS